MPRKSLKDQLTEVTEREPEDLHTLPAVLQQRASTNGRKPKRRRRARGETRQQKNLMLHPAVVRMLDRIAEYEGTTPAGVVDLFVVRAIERYLKDEIRFDEVVRESRSPRQDWVVAMQDLDELERQLREWMSRE
jgi:hypothetical protein